VEQFNDRQLLPALGASWHDVCPADLATLSPEVRSTLHDEAVRIIGRNFPRDAPVCVLKEPRIGMLLPFWLEVLASAGFEVRCACAVRDPLSVARSLHARDRLPIAHGACLYASMWIASHVHAVRLPAAYVEFEAMLKDPRVELARMASALGVTLPGDFEQRVAAARRDFLDATLCHSSVSTGELALDGDMPAIAVDVYRALRGLATATPESAANLRDAICAMQPELDRLYPFLRSHDRLHGEVIHLRQSVINFSDEVAGLKSALRGSASQEADLRTRNEALQSQVSSLESEVARLGSKAEGLESEVARLESMAEGLAAEHDGIQSALQASLLQSAELLVSRDALEQKVLGLEATVAHVDSHSARMESQSAHLARDADAQRETVRYLEHVVASYAASSSWRMTAPFRRIVSLVKSNPWSTAVAARQVRASGLFDPAYYVLAHPGEVPDHQDALRHFLAVGGLRGLDPSPLFDCTWYLDSNPDVRAAGINPLLHYVRVGRREGRKAHPHDAGAASEPVMETSAAREMRIIRESGMFDMAYYLDQYPDVRQDGIGPIDHYVLHGWREGRNPSEHFDTRFYLREYLGGEAADVNPLMHYIRLGRHAGYSPSERHRTVMRERAASGGVGSRLAVLGRRARAVRAAVRHHGGPAGVLRAAASKVASRGPSGLVGSVRHQLRAAHGIMEMPPSQGLPLPAGRDEASAPGAGGPDRTVPRDCRVLFVGCDALVAGSQVLLLNELKWLQAHTAIDIRTILIGGGELLSEYAACGPVTVWREFAAKYADPGMRRARLKELFGDVDLVYGNTVVAASIYSELEVLGVPVITHIHELEKSIRSICSAQELDALTRLTTRFIACSAPVAQNLVESHGIAPERIATVNAFIEARSPDGRQGRTSLRRKLGIRDSAFVVVGCGTIYARKGVDLFVETAVRLKQRGVREVQFLWIGTQYWDLDPQSRAVGTWRSVQQSIEDNGIAASIRFLGQLGNAREYFEAADVFYLPSREDPFPLVCLEAAQVGTPIVCFAGCGGMPSFVGDDAGIVVPCLDVDAAAHAIATLRSDPSLRERLGRCASEKLAQLHTDDIALPRILGEIRSVAGAPPPVSVIVPVFNHAKFLERRIESILGQSFRDVEVIILDDASTDGSLEVATRYGHLPHVRVIPAERNSGSAFGQWAKGLQLARGRFVWIAESDDSSAPQFLEELLPSFADSSVALAFCDSRVVDESDRPLDGYAGYYRTLDRSHWRMDYVLPAVAEVNYGLGVKNTIPNVSAVVFRRSCVTPEILEAVSRMQFAGDWMFHLRIALGHKIAYRSLPLNVHRKHASTLTRKFNTDPKRAQMLLDEVSAVHQWVIENVPLTATFGRRLESYVSEQVGALFPGDRRASGNARYPIDQARSRATDAALRTAGTRRRIAFITTNDWSHDGGSEQLWIHAAKRMAQEGHCVMAIIRRWEPEPYFIGDFRRLGIDVVLKDSEPALALSRFSPDLVVVNIGDQDEGVEWYRECRSRSLPYVIVNHLTKEPRYWPIREQVQDDVRRGNLAAARVFFTSRNNRSLMERRIGCRIPSAELFHNPLFLDRSRDVALPPVGDVVRLAIPSRLLNIHKGQAVAIEVFSMRKWRERRIELHLYGNGPDEQSLRDGVSRRGLVSVHFHDPKWQLPRPDMESIWRACHGLLMPSFMEGMPLVLLNAMFHGRVPIVTDIGGHREVVEDGVSGFIAREPTPDAVDEALERAWQRRAEWDEIGRRARESMLEFAPEDPVGDLVEKLQLVIAGVEAR
jgi:glycosyltransferase involved in cell wall biosynthesis